MLTALPDAHIVRTAWVYTGVRHGLRRAIRRAGFAGRASVDVVADQIGSPTYVGDLSRRCCRSPTARSRAPLLHAANDGAASRFEQAQAVFEASAPTRSGFGRWRSDEHPRPAPRPPLLGAIGRQVRRGRADAAAALAGGAGRGATVFRAVTLDAVTIGSARVSDEVCRRDGDVFARPAPAIGSSPRWRTRPTRR